MIVVVVVVAAVRSFSISSIIVISSLPPHFRRNLDTEEAFLFVEDVKLKLQNNLCLLVVIICWFNWNDDENYDKMKTAFFYQFCLKRKLITIIKIIQKKVYFLIFVFAF